MKRPEKKFKKVYKPEGNPELRNQWISALEDLDKELERICEKRDIPYQK